MDGKVFDRIEKKYLITKDDKKELLKTIKKHMKKDGYFLCSGIIDIRAEEVEKALCEKGYTIIEKMTHDNWVAFLAK